MTEVKLTKENVSEAYKVADDKVKRVLDALFGKAKIRPTLDDYTTIRTYEDACEALGEDEIDEECLHEAGCPNHIIALMKLERISKALWGRNFEPIPDAEGRKYFYYPYFCLYTQDEMKNMSADDCGALLAADALTGAYTGFGYLHTSNRSSYSHAATGFRLCQETETKASYFGKQFIRLWAEYYTFNFKIKD